MVHFTVLGIKKSAPYGYDGNDNCEFIIESFDYKEDALSYMARCIAHNEDMNFRIVEREK